ncbi:MAG: 16S rRNA (adenine(1518)-N(6)/adenine(1519)-N(6))-dimethyltransferase RsmA [Alphaproteobacteria bacterium]|nr:16S rRNA (adenine(1518)-N(6)/adenine(1519)-N(6))-dimethyltransferase RsmA [Alphaproteobacteria bacterium]
MTLLKEKIEKLPSLRTTVEAYGLIAKKALGQNFLLDRNITDKIIRLSLGAQKLSDFSGSDVFEVGSGPGGLTRAIFSAEPNHLTVVEMDERCIAIAQDIQSLAPDRMDIINGDALKVDFSTIGHTPRHIISNLPYNVSVPLLFGWLKSMGCFQSLTLMFQKEVADRILAPIKTKDYGRVSILSQLQCSVEKLMDVSPDCFVPAPKVWSSVLLFRPLEKLLTEDQIVKIEKLTQIVFAQRRKMIRQSLKGFATLESAAQKANILLTMRPEEITPQQFLLLAENLL